MQPPFVPSPSFFPRTAHDLLQQVRLFTGLKICLAPHWNIVRPDWFPAHQWKRYAPVLDAIRLGRSRSVESFSILRDDLKGAFICYADTEPRWSGRLSSQGSPQDEVADRLCHEIGHLLVRPARSGLTDPEILFFNEQTAVLLAALIKRLVGNRYVRQWIFPSFRCLQPEEDQADTPFATFDVYTPSPLALFLANGVFDQTRFVARDGSLRLDRIARFVTRQARHLRWHLSALQTFGATAFRLGFDNAFAASVRNRLPPLPYPEEALTAVDRDVFAAALLRHWWSSVTAGVVGHAPGNLYVGHQDVLVSQEEALTYFHRLGQAVSGARAYAPRDLLLPRLDKDVSAFLRRPAHVPRLYTRARSRAC
jgi:hypothetical protein